MTTVGSTDSHGGSAGASVVEVDVGHVPRQGASRYSPLRLTRLALHVLAGFWPQPIQWAGVVLGVVCTLAAAGLGIYGVVYWIGEANFPGPLFLGAAVIFVLGVQGFVLALVGEHLVQFTGQGERLELVHRATHRDVFARGALQAAARIHGRPPGLYSLRDLLFGPA